METSLLHANSFSKHIESSKGTWTYHTHLPSGFPGDRPTDIWIRRRILGREVLLETTQQINRLSEFLVHLLRCPVPGLSRGL